jgi:hypothetical protein
MKNGGVRAFFEILSPSADKPRARDKAKVNMDQTTKTHIRNLMSGLAQTQPKVLDYPVQELAASRWMSGSYDHFIVQIELLHHRNEAVLHSCLARDGSGPLKTHFLTMLMLEDTIAYASAPHGICSGAATVTMFKFIDFTNMTAAKLAQIIANFTNLNAVIFADYLESNVSSALYQQADLV